MHSKERCPGCYRTGGVHVTSGTGTTETKQCRHCGYTWTRSVI
ncbi:hypothetical protein [uncultured Methanobacterium sp.]|nr:hypothetical protein [uncultured Methanobacterium sp.]